ncbi:MAG: bifunctional chorismate mutase/prephenate dehydratase [Acidobacteriota bacterium]|nr:bifunctional chorismate mutase/prephenate dehydratase [Acidobacteriota bacterium]
MDEVDRRLLEVLRDRLETVAGIAQVKAEGLSFLRDHDRETELLTRVEGWARELGLDGFRTHEIFREIIAMSLKAQEEALLKRDQVERSSRGALRVAFQGIEASYSQLAASKYFAARSASMEFVGQRTFAEALAMAESGDVGYAFLPIENTTAGSINQTYDLLRQTDLRIVGEEILHVRHCLLGVEGAEPAGLQRVLSHPQALTQCSRYLAGLGEVELVAFEDTAASAREVRRAGLTTQGGIASFEAAEAYGLQVLEEGIADQEENWTRFVVISGLEIELDPRIPSKTSLVLTTPHREGALAHCLHILAEHDLNLTKLESRPVPSRPWEYLFYVDIEGSVDSESAALGIAELRRECPYLRVLGSYPARTTAAGAVDRYNGSEE